MTGYAEACKRLTDKYFPEFTEEQSISFYWGATAFPFGDARYLYEQVKRKSRQTKDIKKPEDRLKACFVIADEELEQAMRE